jgi:flagellar M-ring protein FliF
LNTRVVSLLEPVIGPERVRVNVALKLNPSAVEQTEERFDPASVIRSKQVTADSTTTTMPGGGLAGARGNAPPPAPDPKNPTPPAPVQQASAGGTGASRTAETTNYEVSRTTVVTQRPPGEIARLSIG